MAYADAIGNTCAGACLIYFVVLVIYTTIDMKVIPGHNWLTMSWGKKK